MATVYLNYNIVLTDRDQVAAYQSSTFPFAGGGVGKVVMSPVEAASTYGPPGVPLGICFNDQAFFAPSLQSEAFGTSTNHTNFPLDQTTFQRRNGSWFGWILTGFPWLFPGNTRFYWVGQFVWGGVQTDNTGVPGEHTGGISQRYWIDGGELLLLGEGGSGTAVSAPSGSRHTQGMGYVFDAANNISRSHTTDESGMARPTQLWERFYIRVRKYPSSSEGAVQIWRDHMDTSNACGVIMQLLPDGSIAFQSSNNIGTLTALGGAGTLSLNVWYKIDLVRRAGVGPGIPFLHYYRNGVRVGAFSPLSAYNNAFNITICNIGTSSAPGANTAAFDVDDWIGAAYPAHLDPFGTPFPGAVPGIDWLSGSMVALVNPNGFAASHQAAAWTGDWSLVRQKLNFASGPFQELTTATGLARLAVTTDAKQTIDREPFIVGYAAMTVCKFGSCDGLVHGQLGYKLPGGVDVLANITEATTGQWKQAWFHPIGVIDPPTTLDGLELMYVLGNDANTAVVRGLFAVVEILGTFNPEDPTPYKTTTEPNPVGLGPIGIHNAPYPRTVWARKGQAPYSAYIIHSGTYVGNGTATEILLRSPVHYLFVRNVTTHVGFEWWSAMIGPHAIGTREIRPWRLPVAEINYDFVGSGLLNDQEQQTRLRIAGNEAIANQNGVTYEYVTVSDPGMRYLICGALWKGIGATAFINGLDVPSFTPEGGFFQKEAFNDTAGAPVEYYKGVGHAADAISPLDLTQITGAIVFGAGSVTYESGFNLTTPNQTAYALWRRHDGNADPGEPGVVQLFSYTGNATSPRVIPFAVTSGLRPLFCRVVPHNGVSFFRDPSHTGTISTQFQSTVNAATGITAGGIDSITVGSALNAAGIVYDVFILPGGTVAGNNGWSADGEFIPVAPTTPVDGPWTAPPPYTDSPTPPDVGTVPTFPPPPIYTPPPDGTLPVTPQALRGGCYPLSQAIIDVSARLGDPGNAHWTVAEVTRYIVEALRTYNAYTQSYRNQDTFNTAGLQTFYNLPTMIPALRGYNVTDQQLVTDCEYALMEPPTPTAWTGSSQFTLQDLVDALQRRRDQFLKETGAVVTREVTSVTPASSGRMALPLDVLTVRRAAWIMNDGVTVIPLHREDEWALNNFSRGWIAWPQYTSQAWPTGYSVGVTPPYQIQIAPPPANSGALDLLAVVLGSALNPVVGSGVLMGIPDDWTWVVRFGAMSDLLSKEGLSYDPQRAAYCEARWQLGLKMATQASVVLAGQNNGVPTRLYSVQEADQYRRTWQSTPARYPASLILTIGQNLVALNPPPIAWPIGTVTLDVVANMPVPVNSTDCVNMGVDLAELDIIFDYVVHLATFKEGPGQLDASMALYQRFSRACGIEDTISQASIPNNGPILQQTVQDQRIVPRQSIPEETVS